LPDPKSEPLERVREIRADVVLAEFAEVPVRSFVLTLGRRRAREWLITPS
jgi:hypothetical protein